VVRNAHCFVSGCKGRWGGGPRSGEGRGVDKKGGGKKRKAVERKATFGGRAGRETAEKR